MKDTVVTIIVKGECLHTRINLNMIEPLAKALRKEGKIMVHTTSGSYEAEGLVVMAKGSTSKLLLITDNEIL